MATPALPNTLLQAVKFFAKPENVLSYMAAKRWPNGVTCPVCGGKQLHFDKTRMGWRCVQKHPRRKFTLKTGTIFEDSPIGLDKWLPVIWLVANCKNGISSYEVARDLGVTQKTAWFMLHRARLAMQGADGGKLSGEVEADETFIGVVARFMHKGRREKKLKGRTGHFGKAAVFGLLERSHDGKSSRVRTSVVSNVRRNTLQGSLAKNIVTDGTTTVYSDALRSYMRSPRKWTPTDEEQPLTNDNVHKVIDHAEAYVHGEVHANGMENYWSLLKRPIKGPYVSVEPFHLFRYSDEQAFWFNERKLTDAERFGIVVS